MLSSRQFVTIENPIAQSAWDSNVNEQEPKAMVVVHQLIPDPLYKRPLWWRRHSCSRRIRLDGYGGWLGFFECLDCAFYLRGLLLEEPLGWHRQWPAQHQGQHIVWGCSCSWHPAAVQRWCASMPRGHQMSVWVPGAMETSCNTPSWSQHGQLPEVDTARYWPPMHGSVTQRSRTRSPI